MIMKSNLIWCNFCGESVSIEDFENHIDTCQKEEKFVIGDEVIYPNGQIEFRELSIKSRKLPFRKSDDENPDELPERHLWFCKFIGL